MRTVTFSLLALIALFVVAGCNSQSQSSMTPSEEKALRAAPGQPMPEEARKMMEKANNAPAAPLTGK